MSEAAQPEGTSSDDLAAARTEPERAREIGQVNELVGDDLDAQATSTSGSSVSRRFKAATDPQLDELLGRDRSELDLAGLMLDGGHLTDAGCVVALAIGADGTKVPVGRGVGDTENKTVVTALLADLLARPATPTAGSWS
jgi:putative transposase